MPRRGASVTQADIARIVRGMRAAGVQHVRTVIRDDGIYIEPDIRDQARAHERPDETVAEPERIVPL